jgi:hypothetical protein
MRICNPLQPGWPATTEHLSASLSGVRTNVHEQRMPASYNPSSLRRPLSTGNIIQRHKFNRGDAEIAQTRKLSLHAGVGALIGEGADMQLIK